MEAWGRLDGLAAIEAASVNESPYDRERLQAMALSGYVSDDSEAAMSWLQQQDDSEVLTRGLIKGMMGVDVRLTTASVESMLAVENPKHYVADIATHQLAMGFEHAERWAEEIHDSSLRKEAFSQLEDRQLL